MIFMSRSDDVCILKWPQVKYGINKTHTAAANGIMQLVVKVQVKKMSSNETEVQPQAQCTIHQAAAKFLQIICIIITTRTHVY